MVTPLDVQLAQQRRRELEHEAEHYRRTRQQVKADKIVTSKSPLHKVFLLVMSIIPGFIR